MKDPHIYSLAGQQDGELLVCQHAGVAYDPNPLPFQYDERYWMEYQSRSQTEIGKRINDFRCDLAAGYAFDSILDVGVGSGSFLIEMERRGHSPVYGYDVNPLAIAFLKTMGWWLDPYCSLLSDIQCVTLWDVLEHMPEPHKLLKRLPEDCYLILTLPIFDDVRRIRESHHYKPGEHLTYWTADGLARYLGQHGFSRVECRSDEIALGRKQVKTFVFVKE